MNAGHLPGPGARRARILLIGLEQASTETLVAHLDTSFEVTWVYRAEDGPKEMARISPDLVIIKHRPPEVDGRRYCPELRRRSSVPIIMLGAEAGAQALVRALSLGADAYLAEPVHLPLLAAQARALLRRYLRGTGVGGWETLAQADSGSETTRLCRGTS